MSKKRKFPDNEETNINQSSAFEEEDRAKCAKFTLLTDTTIEDLPMELHERILLEAVVTEVRERRLACKESADRVVERLRNVCPQWNYIMSTELFRKKLHEILDICPRVQISMTVLVKQWLTSCVSVATLNDEVFMLCHPPKQHPLINVYDRDNLQSVKSTIQLNQVTIPWKLVACSVTNCLYVLYQASDSIEILRVSKVEHQFEVSPWITCSTQLYSRMSICADGSLALYQGPTPSTITIYNTDGTMQHQFELAKPISYLQDIIQKSNGNFILVSGTLSEIDREGNVVNEYDESRLEQVYCAVGNYDWIMSVDECGNVTLLDSEFIPWDASAFLEGFDCSKHLYELQYDKKRNEFMIYECSAFRAPTMDRPTQRLTIHGFTETTIPTHEDSRGREDSSMEVEIVSDSSSDLELALLLSSY